MSEYLVDIQHERLSFFTPAGEVKALNDVSMYLKEGEVLGIVGESGSGKSVTALSILGLLPYPKAEHTPESSIIFLAARSASQALAPPRYSDIPASCAFLTIS